MSSSPYTPPDDLWEVNRSLQLEEALDGANDPRWVDTGKARGEYSLRPLYRALGVEDAMNTSERRLEKPPDRGYHLFCGHLGCGKSTELRRIRNDLHSPDLYYVVFADAAQDLDPNNLRYQDILLHLAARLARQLEDDRVSIAPVHIERLQSWFYQRVEEQAETREFALQVKAGMEVKAGLPFLGRVFAGISNALKTNSTHKQVLRRTLQNYFTDFADGFNHLIQVADQAVRDSRNGKRILFVIDGTDRLREEDARAFFISDVHQLKYVSGLFIYCAPIHLIYESGGVGRRFDYVFKLPMIKVANPDGSRNETGRHAMLEMLHLRAAPQLFDEGVADQLIDRSGGHPRDLLRLLKYAFTHAEHDHFDNDAARQAVRQVASEFQRMLEPEDYELLARIDSISKPPPHTDRTRHLLYNLALLEYNDYYWRSHPAIRTTVAYDQTQKQFRE
ncbi:MAG: AAA family ATPase [Acidobacteria bacterium]|nr:AAA family ATPase [Acidobacteriota bacterium]